MGVLGVSHRLSEEELFDFLIFEIMIIRKIFFLLSQQCKPKAQMKNPRKNVKLQSQDHLLRLRFQKNLHNSLSLKWKMNCAIKDFDILKPLPNKNPLANQVIHKGHFFLIVPRAGLEPARLSASVFETDLSTDSNIWAFACAKVRTFSEMTKF